MSKIEEGFSRILEGLSEEYGLDLSDPNFKETPKRVARAYAEMFCGLRDTKEKLRKILSTGFPSSYTGMVLIKDVRTVSMCPHHFLSIRYRTDLAYIPSKTGNVLGLSKLPRIVEVLSKRPVLQETFTEEITSTLMEIKGCRGAACLVRGDHSCMSIRGVLKPDALTITSSLRGVFEDEDATRAEFLSLTRNS